eukprot:scaffold4641_cov117-Isochrysis_galbana.AAC.1
MARRTTCSAAASHSTSTPAARWRSTAYGSRTPCPFKWGARSTRREPSRPRPAAARPATRSGCALRFAVHSAGDREDHIRWKPPLTARAYSHVPVWTRGDPPRTTDALQPASAPRARRSCATRLAGCRVDVGDEMTNGM